MKLNTNPRQENKADSLYTLEGDPGFLKVLPYSLQQILAMFVENLAPIQIVCAAAVPAMGQEEILSLMQASMIAAGIATFIQATPVWKLGSGLPIFMGISFTFTAALSDIAAKFGYGAVVGAVLLGGLFEGLLGLTVRYWRRMISPIVSAVVVTGIGLSLLSVAARSFGGGYAEDFGSVPNIIIGSVTMLAALLWMALMRGSKKHVAILAGIAAGYCAALLLGRVDFSGISQGAWISLPKFMPYRPVFRPAAIVAVCIVYLVSATETLGDASAITGGLFRRPLTRDEMTGVLTVDGMGSFISGLFGATPVTSYSENIGLAIMTGAVNRNIARVGAAIMIFCGIFPPVSRIIRTIPEPVIGGVLLMVMGEILVSGIELIAEAGFTTRNRLITAISLSVAVGFTGSSAAGIWDSFPVFVQTLFSQNVVAVIFVIAILLNLTLPKEMDEQEKEKA